MITVKRKLQANNLTHPSTIARLKVASLQALALGKAKEAARDSLGCFAIVQINIGQYKVEVINEDGRLCAVQYLPAQNAAGVVKGSLHDITQAVAIAICGQ